MLLTISTTAPHASDFGFLLHKHPDRVQSFELSFGQCHVFYPESSTEKSTCCLLLDVDNIQLAKGKRRQNSFALAGYVNDRPFVASSFLSVAISQVLGSALGGRCKDKPELANQSLNLEVSIDVVHVSGGESFLRSIFEPLGYQVETESGELDPQFPSWGPSPYFKVLLQNRLRLSELLSHLYVLIPVFDNQKHYFVSRDELEKLLHKGEGWLADHPGKEQIAKRYLRYQPGLFRQALERLMPEADDEVENEITAEIESVPSLNEQRMSSVLSEIKKSSGSRVIDLGCGEGKLLKHLAKEWQFSEIVGVDVSTRALEIASRRLRLDELPSFQADRIKLIHGSLMYRDKRFETFDVAAVVEVIEHLDPPRIAALERVLFQYARPSTIVMTTPNAEYNVMWPSLPAGKFRHADHRFEWTRAEFQEWGQRIAENFDYQVEFKSVGPVDAKVGSPTQMAVFRFAVTRAEATSVDEAKLDKAKGGAK